MLMCNIDLKSQSYIPFDLTQKEQQVDFLHYIKNLSSLLQDTSMSNIAKAIRREKKSDTAKSISTEEVYKHLLSDSAYLKRVMTFYVFAGTLEKKYGISKFTNYQWDEISQFAVQNGVTFIKNFDKFIKQGVGPKQNLYSFPKLPRQVTKQTTQ